MYNIYIDIMCPINRATIVQINTRPSTVPPDGLKGKPEHYHVPHETHHHQSHWTHLYWRHTPLINNHFATDQLICNLQSTYSILLKWNTSGSIFHRKFFLINSRFVRDLSKRKLEEPFADGNTSATVSSKENGFDDGKTNYRLKRQSPGRMELCETNFQYVTPQAALNSQGKIQLKITNRFNGKIQKSKNLCPQAIGCTWSIKWIQRVN